MLLPYLLYNSELPIFTHKKLPVPGKATFLYRFVKKKFLNYYWVESGSFQLIPYLDKKKAESTKRTVYIFLKWFI